jgi:hypothetical protein
MTAFSLLSSSRDLVNQYFKLNVITLAFVALGIFVSYGVDSITQPMEINLAQQIATGIFGAPIDLNVPEAFAMQIAGQDLTQIPGKLQALIAQPQLQQLFLALMLISLGMVVVTSLVELGKISMGLEIAGNTEQKSWKSFFS